MGRFYGGSSGETIEGTSEDDYIDGDGGGDTLYGYGGADNIDGWTGDDVIFGGTGDDNLEGHSGRDILYGEDGNDELTASFGVADDIGDADKLYGGAGDDILYDNYNGNVLDGGGGYDTVYWEARESGSLDVVITASSIDQQDAGVVDSLSSVEEAHLYGGSSADVLDGSAAGAMILHLSGGQGGDTLRAASGDDYLYGGDGLDLIYAGGGDDFIETYPLDGGDQIYGQGGFDTVEFDYSTNGNVTITDTAITHSAYGGYTSQISGVEKIVIDTSSYDSTIDGSAATMALDIFAGDGDDVVLGGAGDDVITGYSHTDTMTGGAGADVFRILRLREMRDDAITDFSAGDRINFESDPVFNGTVPIFIGTAAFSGTANELRYEKTGGQTLIHADTDGDGTEDETMTLLNGEFDLEETSRVLSNCRLQAPLRT